MPATADTTAMKGWTPENLPLPNINTPDMNNYLQTLLDRITEYTTLKRNWDSYDAPPFNQTLIDRTKHFVTVLTSKGIPPQHIIPAPGTIISEWSNDSIHLEIHLDQDEDDLIYIEHRLIGQQTEYIGPLTEVNNRLRTELNNALISFIPIQRLNQDEATFV